MTTWEKWLEAEAGQREAAGLTRDTCVFDVGGGASHLVDALIARALPDGPGQHQTFHRPHEDLWGSIPACLCATRRTPKV